VRVLNGKINLQEALLESLNMEQNKWQTKNY
jgi:hypothetical protein